MNERYRQYRDLNGILLLDKPIHLTSNMALQKVKHLVMARKAGHTGSLDPLATGMLPICFGEATKFSQYLLEADKAYRVTAKLGIKTTTSDAEGSIVATAMVPEFSTDSLETVFNQFRGNILQVPSMFSALKHEGQPLYKLARQGIEIERPARPVTIHELRMLEQLPDELVLEVRCSKGTYIRNLVEDIGDVLGCLAHVSALRRLYVEPFSSAPMIHLEDITPETRILPVEEALKTLPIVRLAPESAFFVRNGQSVTVNNEDYQGVVTLYDDVGRFLGVGDLLEGGRVMPKRLLKKVPS